MQAASSGSGYPDLVQPVPSWLMIYRLGFAW